MAMPPDGPAGAFRPDPDDPWPSSRAEIFVYLDSDDAADRPRSRPLDSDQMLRTVERMVLAVMWPFAVIGTLFGAGSAHLSPAGATIVIVLEILIPPLVFRGRRSLAGHRFGRNRPASRAFVEVRHRTEPADGTYHLETAGLAAIACTNTCLSAGAVL
jgi:hypothetical protein